MSNIKVVAGAPAARAAVGMVTSPVGVIHAGILFRGSDETYRVLHLAFHCQLECESSFEGWAHVVSNLDEFEIDNIAAHCVTLQDVRPVIPYSFKFETSTFAADGRFVPGPGESGLTCSTFVLAVIEWATKVPLVEVASWQPRPDDTVIQQKLLTHLKKVATPEHVAAVSAEVGCVRVRTEEAAAASAMDGRPIGFVSAAAEGIRVKASFEALST